MRALQAFRTSTLALTAAVALWTFGCGDDTNGGNDKGRDAGAKPDRDKDGGDASASGNDGDEDGGNDAQGSGSGRPVYVLANEVFGADDESTSYLNVLQTLDVDELDYDKAVEFGGGRATIATYNGWLFVVAPETPSITRYEIDEAGALKKTGEVSFVNYGLTALAIDEWSINFISATKSYLVNFDDGATLIWDPTTMEITGEIAPPDLVRAGKTLNGSPGVVRGNRLYRTFFWNDWDAYETSDEQYLAIYDLDEDKLLDLVEERRCPGLGNRVSQDSKGNLYFSNWIWNVTETLVKGAPESCALRIKPGEDAFDADWVLRFPELTGGRQGAMLNLVDDKHAMLSVFYDERATIDKKTDPSELAGTENWRVWLVDLDAKTGEPIEGISWMAGASSVLELDGRSFVLVPGEDWAVTHVQELVDGKAISAFDVRGWCFQFLKVR